MSEYDFITKTVISHDPRFRCGELAGIMSRGVQVMSTACVRIMMAAVVILAWMLLAQMRAVKPIMTVEGLPPMPGCGFQDRWDSFCVQDPRGSSCGVD